ncbi:hypothetical protein [Canibacter zhoujuaniae]|uniref:hypothetical protein n=1 Tax=Canibacter zhoujuaniae TaxID=2708343 RepID=UPI00142000B4|nr:hypothetical protein [Canibacter zhoujuaniae]
MLSLELRTSPFKYGAFVIYAVAVVFAVSNSYKWLATWTSVTTEMLAAQAYIAPLICCLAAWSGLRSKRQKMHETEAAAVRSVAAVRALQILADAFWLVVASMVAFLVLLLRGVSLSLRGTPVWPAVLMALFVCLLYLAIGHTVAALISHWAAIPLAGAVALAIYVSRNYFWQIRSLLWLSPMNYQDGFAVTVPNPLFYSGQLLIVGGYILALLVVYYLVRGSRKTLRLTTFALLAVPVLIVGFATVKTNNSPMLANQPKMVTVTDPRTGFKLTLIEEYEPLGAEIAAGWGRISELFSESDLRFDSLRQLTDDDFDYSDLPKGTVPLSIASRPMFEDSVDVIWLNQITNCEPFSGELGLAGDVVVAAWLADLRQLPSNVGGASKAEIDRLNWLHSLSIEEAKKWVTEHTYNMQNCAWNKSDFGSL